MSAESVKNAAGAATIATTTVTATSWLTEHAAVISTIIAMCTFIVFAVASGINSWANVKRTRISEQAAKETTRENKRKIIGDIIKDAEGADPEVKEFITNHFRGKP